MTVTLSLMMAIAIIGTEAFTLYWYHNFHFIRIC